MASLNATQWLSMSHPSTWSMDTMAITILPSTIRRLPTPDAILSSLKTLISLMSVLYANLEYYLPRFTTFLPDLKVLFAILFAIAVSLFALGFPEPCSFGRKLIMVPFTSSAGYAFFNHNRFTNNHHVNDTLGRFLYIWAANLSYKVTILEFSPQPVKDKETIKTRLYAAYKVLFDPDYHGTEEQLQQQQRPQKEQANENSELEATHTAAPPSPLPPKKANNWNLTRTQFILFHIAKCLLFYTTMQLWNAYWDHTNAARLKDSPDHGSFFRRLPSSLTLRELRIRFEDAVDLSGSSVLFYDAFLSVFAIFFVGILRLDEPHEWKLSLFGWPSEAWSVRRYWGKHWHNFIYFSFSSHIKIVTRGGLGMRRGSTVTRLVENSLVFTISGLAHSLVKYVQMPEQDCWAFGLWFAGQILPIVAEQVVQYYWVRVKRRYGLEGYRVLKWIERAFGYAWVLAWMMWSIPKYHHTSTVWTHAKYKKAYEKVRSQMGYPPNASAEGAT